MALLNVQNPDIILQVPLESIRYFIPNEALKPIFGQEKVKKTKTPGFIWEGDWDREVLDLNEHFEEYSTSYRSVFQIFDEGLHYQQSDEYKEKAQLIRKGIYSVRGKTEDELNSYFEKLEKLKKTIEISGYRSQGELGEKKIHDEIGVFVDRNGNLIKAEDDFSGTHRFAIAKVLNLPSVYINVVAIHRKWAEDHVSDLIEGRQNLVEKFNRSKYV